MSTTKICRKCKKELPIENFRIRKGLKRSGEPFYFCIPCEKNANQKQYEREKEQAIKIKLMTNEEKTEQNRIDQIILDAGGGPGNFHRVGLERVCEFVKEKHDGYCISTMYINSKIKLSFKCKYDHEWDAAWTNIMKGKWCPECSSFAGERITRTHFQQIFDKKFSKGHFDWLCNSNGYKMELDGYCVELGIGFEHHGMQHYKINEFSKTKAELLKRQADDRYKEELCQQHGVKLIIVPQVPDLTKIAELKYFIKAECDKLGIIIEKDINELQINLDLEPISHEYLKNCQEFAISMGGRCLSAAYINSGTPLQFECKRGHKFKNKSYSIIIHKEWCGRCNLIERKLANPKPPKIKKERYKKQPVIVNWDLPFLERYQDIARQHDGLCLSIKYIDAFTDLTFQCKNAHTWNARPNNMLYGAWCKICSRMPQRK